MIQNSLRAALMLVLAGCAKTIAPSSNAQLEAFLARPDQVRIVEASARQQMRRVQLDCAQGRYEVVPTVRVTEKVFEFGPDGVPTNGNWIQDVNFSGCGREIAQHFYAVSSQGKVLAVMGPPGDTALPFGPALDQVRALQSPGLVPRDPACRSVQVANVRGGPMPGTLASYRRELWYLDACGKRVTAAVSWTVERGTIKRTTEILRP